MQKKVTIKKIYQETFKISEGDHSNMYLLIGKHKAMLIDSSWGISNLYEIVKNLTDLPIIVMHTHGHPDHISGAFHFPINYVHINDLEITRNNFLYDHRLWAVQNIIGNDFEDERDKETWISKKCPKLLPITKDMTLDLGNRILTIRLIKGHSQGSISIIDKMSRRIFIGDNLIRGHVWLHLDHSSSLRDYINGLERLLPYKDDIDFFEPGHGDSIPFKDIHEVIELARSIENNEINGLSITTFAGEGIQFIKGAYGLVCRNSIYNSTIDSVLDET